MYDVVGKPVTKNDAWDKVTGRTKYAADLYYKDMLYGKTLGSPIASGYVKSIDTSAAEALEGVAAVLTRKDVPGPNTYGIMIKDQPVLVGIGEKIRKYCDPVALVAAESEAIAEAALKLIKVEYEETPGVFSMEEALQEGAPLVFDHCKNNILSKRVILKGDVDAAFAQCAHIVEQEYSTQMIDHAFIEPECGVGLMEGDVVTVYCSTQNVHYDLRDIVRNLNIGMHKARVVQSPTGGGFGGKLDVTLQVHLALLAQKTRRPVKMVYSREEHMNIAGKRHPFKIRMKTGIDKEGRLLAHECLIHGDTGAYSSYGPGVLTRSAVHASGPYEVPNAKVEALGVLTNNPFCCAMRGFGISQVAFAMENQLDFLAELSGVSQYDIRHINALRKGSKTLTGQVLQDSAGLVECLEKTKAKADQVFTSTKGVGIGCMMYGIGNTGLPNPAGAVVDLYDDGTVGLLTGCADIGQGSNTIMAQIVAEELGVDYEDVRVVSADTLVTPDGGATSASRQTYISGNACRLAAANAKRELFNVVGKALGVAPDDLQIKKKVLSSISDPSKTMSLQEGLDTCRGAGVLTLGSAFFNPDTTGFDANGHGSPYAAYAFGTHMAEVEVDEETGMVTVKNLIVSSDVGQAINPKQVEGQLEGGCVHNLGYTITEEVIVKNGKIQNPNFANYLLITTMDAPEIHTIIVEDPVATGPFGAKGVGEPALIPTVAAVSNAVSNYTGIRFTELPLTPENVRKRIREARQ